MPLIWCDLGKTKSSHTTLNFRLSNQYEHLILGHFKTLHSQIGKRVWLFWMFKIFNVKHKHRIKHHIAIWIMKSEILGENLACMNIPMTFKKSHSLLIIFHYILVPLVCFLCKCILRHNYLVLFSSPNQFWLHTCSSVRFRRRKKHFSFQKLSKTFFSYTKVSYKTA